MNDKLKLVKINTDYCEFLRKYEKKVSYNWENKSTRPFVGVLFKVDNFEYFAPLSSPKLKHKSMKNTIDFVKIAEGNLGAINFNNMLPVHNDNYSLVDLKYANKSEVEKMYIMLLIDQLFWLNENYLIVKKKSKKLYDLYKSKKLPLNIERRCCNYLLLEKMCDKYNCINK